MTNDYSPELQYVAKFFDDLWMKYGVAVETDVTDTRTYVTFINAVSLKHKVNKHGWYDEILFDNGVKVTVDGRGNVEVYRDGEKLESVNFGEKGVRVDRATYSSTWDPRYKKTAAYLFVVTSEEDEI